MPDPCPNSASLNLRDWSRSSKRLGRSHEVRRVLVLLELLENDCHDGPIPLLAEHPLRFGCADVVNECLRLVAVLRVLDDRHRVLYQDRLVGQDVFELLALLLRRDHLVLIREHHVALPAGKGGERLARSCPAPPRS